ncbi:MAG: hypothetical protein IJ623_00905 [Bacteroidales bacterium]|nr:hypothetical protein [Bacteroidales bacterium]
MRLEILREQDGAELATVRQGGSISPELVFKSPYFLDFTGLKGYYTELPDKDLLKAQLQKQIAQAKLRLENHNDE